MLMHVWSEIKLISAGIHPWKSGVSACGTLLFCYRMCSDAFFLFFSWKDLWYFPDLGYWMMVKSRRKQGFKVVERSYLKRSLSLSVAKTLETSCVLFRSFQEKNKFLGNCELIREMHMPGTACFLLKHSKNNALVTKWQCGERGKRNCGCHLMWSPAAGPCQEKCSLRCMHSCYYLWCIQNKNDNHIVLATTWDMANMGRGVTTTQTRHSVTAWLLLLGKHQLL